MIAHLRATLLLVRAEEHLARGRPEACWRLLERVQSLLRNPWPTKALPAYVNLQVGMAALHVQRFELARACASMAERAFIENKEGLPAPDATYLRYYAVMISRLAQAKAGDAIQLGGQFYPTMREEDVDQVSSRWRRKFPLVQVPPQERL